MRVFEILLVGESIFEKEDARKDMVKAAKIMGFY
jgi:hypothetical protein